MSDSSVTLSSLKRFIVIDRNFGAAKITSKQANLIYPGRYELFTDFQKGFHAIQESTPVAVFIDLQIDNGGSGMAMLSRLRRDPKFVHLPVIITSATISVTEVESLHGYPCSAAVAKPIHQRDLRGAFKKVFDESVWYRQNLSKLDQTFSAIESDPMLASQNFKSLLATAPNPMTIALTFSNTMVRRRLYSYADQIYDEILNKYPSSVPTINAKAKSFCVQGRYKQAKTLLERSFQMAPKGIERLALLGDIEISLKNPAAAMKCFHEALGIDPTDKKSRVGLTIANGYSRLVSQQVNENYDEPSIAKVMNNLGVSLAQKGSFEKALKYYLMSLSFLGADDLQSRVSFNLGLGYKKWNKPQQAKYWLEEAVRLNHGPYRKAEFHLLQLSGVTSSMAFVEMPATSNPVAMVQPVAVNQPMVLPKSPIAPIGFADDFLDEERVEMVPGLGKSPNKFGFSDDQMLAELDGNLSLSDLDVTFDEAI